MDVNQTGLFINKVLYNAQALLSNIFIKNTLNDYNLIKTKTLLIILLT